MAKIVSKEEYVQERLKLLEKEKELAKQQNEITKMRQQMPWVEVKNYELSGEEGPVKLSQLFREGTDELFVFHMMMGEGWEKPCSLCSCWMDQLNGALPHVLPRMSFAVVSKAPIESFAKAIREKKWNVTGYSSGDSGFNEEFGVSFDKDQVEQGNAIYNYNRKWSYGTEAPGFSVFKKKDGKIYNTYNTYAAGMVPVSPMHALLDMTVTGRNELDQDGKKRNMYWVKHKETYNN
eukprot:m.7701 g.7701  ORF g.7701 m.7701 type:complete len:235 (+) comp3758_c0_seq1:129-833(+)